MQNSTAYVNVHSTFAPGGEIKGFLAPIPEPTALPLLAVGFLLVARRVRAFAPAPA